MKVTGGQETDAWEMACANGIIAPRNRPIGCLRKLCGFVLSRWPDPGTMATTASGASTGVTAGRGSELFTAWLLAVNLQAPR
jgi:hypothetical protein